MGQTWSKFMSGHIEAANNLPISEIEPSPSVEQSQASIEASNRVLIYQGGSFSVAAADVELSSLKDDKEIEWDKERDQERGKETQTTSTPTLSTSQHLSPLKAFLKGPEKAHFKKSQTSLLTALKCRPLKRFDQKSRAFKKPCILSPLKITRLQHHTSKVDVEPTRNLRRQQESSTTSPSQFSPSQIPDEEVLQFGQMEENEEETPSQSMFPDPEDDVKIDSAKEGEDLMQPLHSSAQKLLFFDLVRKRKAPAGLPSLAIECMGSTRMKLKSQTTLEKPSERGSRKDLDAGAAVVGRHVRKTISSRGIFEGHVSSYNVSSRLYQIEYDNGKEEAIEWLDLEPYLLDHSQTTNALVDEVKEIKPLRKSLRNAPKVKKIEEFVNTKKSVRGRRRKK